MQIKLTLINNYSMKITINNLFYGFLAITVLAVSSCKKDNNTLPDAPLPAVSGVYILNEGYYDADNGTLSYFDLESKKMTNEFFVAANPGKKLGDVANDMGIYGSKLYITVNRSNKIEIMNAESGVVIKTVNVTAPRFLAFHGKHAFISSYTGIVSVLDTASMTIIKEIEAGRTSEQLAVSGDKVFVANAGWQDGVTGGEYDNRLSVIDANKLEKITDIEVADNIDRVSVDSKGAVYVNATTIYNFDWTIALHPSRLFRINPTTLKKDKEFEFGAELLAFNGDHAYFFSDNLEEGKTLFLEMNTSNFEIKVQNRFEDVVSPYALAIDSKSEDIWVGEAMTNQVYHFNKKENKVEQYAVGLLPKKFVFKR
jgi:hypothetical protein